MKLRWCFAFVVCLYALGFAAMWAIEALSLSHEQVMYAAVGISGVGAVCAVVVAAFAVRNAMRSTSVSTDTP